MKKLDDDVFIFSIPGKFPEAYYNTISELQRRKVYNKALATLCDMMHNVTRAERKTRNAFNGKYGNYLPSVI